ncbi:Microsomal glutathione S-transferase 1 [Mactra antiquata]
MASSTLSLENEVFAKFTFYAGVILLKTVFMSIWTARYRIPRKVFITPEDYGGNYNKALTTDPDVERVRRAHLNDLENVLPFVLLGFFYVLSGPDAWTATLLFRLFTGFRILHTIAYVFVIPQPARGICFLAGFIINVMMAIQIIKAGKY